MSEFKMAPEASSKPLLRGLTTGFGSRWAVGGGSGGDGLIQTAGTLLDSAGTLSHEPLTGHWFDRTQESLARRKGEDADPAQHATTETVTFSPLPCWKPLPLEVYRERVGKMGLEIEEEAAAARKRTGAHPLGAAKILAQHPWTRPERVKRSPAPLLHAASKAVRQIFYEGFALFVAAYRAAAGKLKRGDPNPGFPLGCFPPALPFVGG